MKYLLKAEELLKRPIFYLRFGNCKIKFCLCHRIPERSIPFFGLEKYFCSRCLGVIIGVTLSLILGILGVRMSVFVYILMITPLILDGTTQLIGLRESNNLLRMTTGLCFGLSTLVIW